MTKFFVSVIALCLGVMAPLFAGEMDGESTSQKSFRVGVTQPPMFTLASALAWGSPVEVVLVERDQGGDWNVPTGLTVLFWSGATLEPVLAKQLDASGQAAVSLIDAAGVHQLAKRTPADWKGPSEDEDPHMESLGKGYGMVQTIRPEGLIDTMYWLDPLNAMAALEAITMVYQGLDQRNHWAYQGNSDQIIQALWELDIRVNKLLHEASSQPFVVLQDEFQYLEQRYKLHTVPAGGTAQDIVDKAKARGAKCVVAAEPFDQHLMSVLDQAGLNRVVLDPAGHQMPKTTGGYFQWFGNLASKLNDCVIRS
ncbi:MAG: zinc ABC transporter substrate-binding protein [Candidatus Thiodiazotropha taylori]|uniref:High-affinity zinc uptake system protein ZnuA n=1 Tax=Candidatus Thiodiazotropha taylori TaxID=2792791 RepID=A0A9E4N6L4_9GAMM|nr:zinc ABC transporter substrate-binding protein [Candidatus Thiodiazotropha taylori]MCG7954042.1 zinc ABC transporter substrate-binding protein [Candidatus Thiodiazotropha taylori]MCG7966564.1 zinc ABC transporter substrate-binding protein [Candidatus Thiodiazotropha taylori]MCG8030326.1 zinc ABC transporter substrate-binding protein [Candidatus Thiodiazotropha taylori]MCG8042241.1 zinc ABC transporter substrate-binding protein [Candidatus Thiodiazotropha taylori]